MLVGSVMDNIPENMALGISLVTGGAVNVVPDNRNIHFKFPGGFGFHTWYESQWKK